MRLLIGFCCIFGFNLFAQGGTLPNHYGLYIEGDGSTDSKSTDPLPFIYYNQVQVFDVGPVTLSDTGSGDLNGNQDAASEATVTTDGELKLSAASCSDKRGNYVPAGEAVSSVVWSDIIFLSGGSEPPPSHLLLSFSLDGTLSATTTHQTSPSPAPQYLSHASAIFAARAGNSIMTTPPADSIFFDPAYWSVWKEAEVEGFSYDPEIDSEIVVVQQTLTYLVPYSPFHGGYVFNFQAIVKTSTLDGLASADFLNTITLDSVAYADGSELTGFDIQFDSGFELVTNEPPEIDCSVVIDTLWSPNHELTDIGLQIDATDDSGVDPLVDVYVFANETDRNATGGDAFLDIDGLWLRAERNGNGTGRVYLIVVVAMDSEGETGFDCCTVVVPHDETESAYTLVDGQAAEAELTCLLDGFPPDEYLFVDSFSLP